LARRAPDFAERDDLSHGAAVYGPAGLGLPCRS
jgi:hypothetical protein